MFLILFFFSIILGLCIGSFLNVVIYRYGTGVSISAGRSKCPACNKDLEWYELFPVFSFFAQGGKCRSCKAKISWQYPLVELLSGTLFALVFIRQYSLYPLYSVFPHGLAYSALFIVYYFSIVSLLLVIAVYDLRHKIIPNGLVYWFSGLSLAKLLLFLCICLPLVSNFTPFSITLICTFPYVYDLLAPIIFFLPFWFLWKVSGGRWIGFGDAKLAVGIGALLGFVGGLSAIVLGFWIGAAVCLLLMFVERFMPNLFGNLNAKSEIPLAPFLIVGTLIVLFWHFDVLGIAPFFNV